jgi:hypothetical protein
MSLGKSRTAAILLLGCLFGQPPVSAQARKIRIHPQHHDFQAPPDDQHPDVTYQGGALVAHASYWMVYWSSYWTSGLGLAQRKYFNSFVQTVAPSAGFTALFAEYQEAPQFPILAGNWAGEKVITDGAPTTTVDDSGIVAQINTWITSSVLPVPDANTVYVIFPGAGVDVTQGGDSACDPNNGFLGYHYAANAPAGSFGYYRYIVLPYQNCGSDMAADGPVTINGMTDTLGHEMSETETDPDGGFLAYGWEDPNTGNEIADICADTSATVGFLNFWLQKIWSQAATTCIGPVSGSSAIGLTISQNGEVYPGTTEPSGAANVLAGYPVTFTVSTSSTTPVSLSVSGLPAGVTDNLSEPTVISGNPVTLEISTDASPGANGMGTVTASADSQQAQFQFQVVPWIEVSNTSVTHTAFTSANSYTGTITVKNTGSQAIGPTILVGLHGLDSSVYSSTLNAAGTGYASQVAPTGDYAIQLPDGMLGPSQSVTANVGFTNPFNVAINFTPQVFMVQSPKMCDISQTANTNVADVQLMIDEALGVKSPTDDLNNDGTANIADVQVVINSALGLGCSSGPMI